MPSEHPRILAVSTNPALIIGLTFQPYEWEVSSASTLPEAVDVDLIVFDLGSGATTPSVWETPDWSIPVVAIVDDAFSEEDLPAVVRITRRPYTIDDLVDNVLTSLGLVSGSGENRPAGVDSKSGQHHPSDERTGSGATTGLGGDGVIFDAPSIRSEPGPDSQQPAHDRPSPSGPGFVARLFARALTDQQGSGTPSVLVDREASDDFVIDLVEDGSPQGVTGGLDFDSSAATPPGSQALKSSGGIGEFAGEGAEPGTLTTYRKASRPDVLDVQPSTTATAAPWRSRRQNRTRESQDSLMERLARVLKATHELESLVAQVPLLADPAALARAIVSDLQSHTHADTVALWTRGVEGWHPACHHGFTLHESTWTVADDQPLFAELQLTGGAMLIDPAEALQAFVAGIAGAHTESFMAAAVAEGPGRCGILTVGRDEPLTEGDLDDLVIMARELSPGLAVSRQLARLCELVRTPNDSTK